MKMFRYLVIVIGISVMASAALSATQGTKASDLLTAKQVNALVATAKTPADHMKLSKHYAALAARYDAEANDHEVLAKVYKSGPNAAESKRPGAPDTAVHCDRLGQLARDAAKEARALAAAHEQMAAEKK